jgi:hypothetical protein
VVASKNIGQGDDLDKLLRERGGLEGLAGQDDPTRRYWGPPANGEMRRATSACGNDCSIG